MFNEAPGIVERLRRVLLARAERTGLKEPLKTRFEARNAPAAKSRLADARLATLGDGSPRWFSVAGRVASISLGLQSPPGRR